MEPSGYTKLMRETVERLSAAKMVVIFVALVCVMLSVFEAKRILASREEALQAGTRNTVNLANSLINHAEQTLRGVDTMLIGVRERVEHDGLDPASIERLRTWFRNGVSRIPHYKSIVVIDEHGTLFLNARQTTRVANVSDRDYFLYHSTHDDSALYVGTPVRGRAIGEWILPVSRRFNKPDGSFGGIVLASLDPEFFQKFYDEFDVGKDGAILLASDAGRLLVRRPFAEANIGKDISKGGVFSELKRAPSGTAEIKSATDGVTRINSYVHGKTYPVMIAVAENPDDILAPWWVKTKHEVLEFGVAIGALFLLGLVTWRMTRALDQRAEEVATTGARFKAAMDNMSHGMCLFDAERRVVVANGRYAEMYNLSPEQVRPGTSKRTILGHLEKAGTHFTTTPDAYIATNLRRRSEVQELADGRFVAITRHPMPDGGWLTMHEDVTDRAKKERRVAYLAEHDPLTGLPNRASFMDALSGTVANAGTATGHFAVFMLDLDRFKHVNDTLGHPVGDKLLIEVAQRLRSSLRDSDIVARLGGDEFAIIQPLVNDDKSGTILLALRIIEVIGKPFDIDGHRVGVGTSIGIALAPADGATPEDLLKRADLALYETKAGGRNNYRFFTPEMMANSDDQRRVEIELSDAIELGQLELHYHPLLEASSRRVIGAEALVRWNHPERGLLPPSEFIPVAEACGLIVPLGAWVLRQACRDASTWPLHYRVAVNLSAIQFDQGKVLEQVRLALAESGLSPARLELELTESALLACRPVHLETMRELKKLGVSLALDDFGTGYASTRYLIDYPFDRIKIDRSFTGELLERRDCAAVVASVLALANALGIDVTAEGVETEEQFKLLRASGIDQAQGFLFGEPAPVSIFLARDNTPEREVA